MHPESSATNRQSVDPSGLRPRSDDPPCLRPHYEAFSRDGGDTRNSERRWGSKRAAFASNVSMESDEGRRRRAHSRAIAWHTLRPSSERSVDQLPPNWCADGCKVRKPDRVIPSRIAPSSHSEAFFIALWYSRVQFLPLPSYFLLTNCFLMEVLYVFIKTKDNCRLKRRPRASGKTLCKLWTDF